MREPAHECELRLWPPARLLGRSAARIATRTGEPETKRFAASGSRVWLLLLLLCVARVAQWRWSHVGRPANTQRQKRFLAVAAAAAAKAARCFLRKAMQVPLTLS